MFQYRQVLARLRAGDTDREVSRCGLMVSSDTQSYALTRHPVLRAHHGLGDGSLVLNAQ